MSPSNLVPFMAVLYLVVGLFVVLINLNKVPEMFETIITHALGVKEIAGPPWVWRS